MRGIIRIRRIMRGLPNAMRAQLADALELGGQAIAGQMRARAPRGATGALKAAISFKVFPKTLRLRAGLLEKSRRRIGGARSGRSGSVRTQEGPFYGRIQDLGRKAQTVTVTRHIKARALKGNNKSGNTRRTVYGGKPYTMRVKFMAPKRFVTGRMPEARGLLKRLLEGVWARAVGTIAGGSDA